jgi:hypothetical protein
MFFFEKIEGAFALYHLNLDIALMSTAAYCSSAELGFR